MVLMTFSGDVQAQSEGTTLWNNEFATTSGFDGGDPATCMSPVNGDTTALGQIHKDLFWTFTLPCDGDWQVDTEGSTGNTDTRLNIHVGSDCSATCLLSDDDGGSTPTFSSLAVISGGLGGQTYLIQTGSWSSTGR